MEKDLALILDEVYIALRNDGILKLVAHWMIHALLPRARKENISLEDCKITPWMLLGFVEAIHYKLINNIIAKIVFDEMWKTGKEWYEITADPSFWNYGDVDEIIDNVLKENPAQVAAFINGKETLIGFFVGQVMRQTKGKADPIVIAETIKERIKFDERYRNL